MSRTSFKTALIDADILVYRVGFTTQDVDPPIARARLREIYQRIMEATGAERARCFLTAEDRSNFRFDLFPDYKAHRKDKPKPVHYHFLRNVLVEDFVAEVITGQEADDAIGIAMREEPDAIICTIDKDLNMIPGWHYNFVTDRVFCISELEAQRSFYLQCLEGDKGTDNIEGCRGIGPVKANRMLEGCQNEEEMLRVVLDAYEAAHPDDAHDRLLLAGSLLWIRSKPDEVWHINGNPVSKETLQQFSTSTESLTTTS